MGVSPSLATGDTHDLAVGLAPALRLHTSMRLSEIEWFRSRWQRGGAATGFATWKRSDGSSLEVFVKIPVGYVEYKWTTELGAVPEDHWNDAWACNLPTARVVAHGACLKGYDLAWIITERLAGKPLAAALDKSALMDLLRAAADFQARAITHAPLDSCPLNPDWHTIISASKAIARLGEIENALRWKEALRRVLRSLALLEKHWRCRPINAWCHGDLHAGNAIRRQFIDEFGTPRQTCSLVDLALVHPGHWLEDAMYLERQHWGHLDKLCKVKPLTVLADLRRERGLPVDEHYPRLANIRRVLMASCAPAMRDREGDRLYLQAALENLERFLPQVIRECDL